MTICSPFVTERHGDVSGPSAATGLSRTHDPHHPLSSRARTTRRAQCRRRCGVARRRGDRGRRRRPAPRRPSRSSCRSTNSLPRSPPPPGAAVTALDAYVATGSVADEQTLAWHRAIAARYTAQQLGYDELAMVDAWSSTTIAHQRAVLGALTQVGVPVPHATPASRTRASTARGSRPTRGQAPVSSCTASRDRRSPRPSDSIASRPRPVTSCTTRAT